MSAAFQFCHPLRLFATAGLIILLAACSPAATTAPVAPATPVPSATLPPAPTATEVVSTPTPTVTAKTGWWTNAVFYEIFVRSFSDSNGDGKGDLNGITAKLDYLQQLGITGIWLMPINPSPSYHGYDVIDYRGVNPDYGTLNDFKNLLNEAHKRGIKIIIDYVLNHTSVQNPWFIAAQNTQSDKHDWYIWSVTDPGYAGPFGGTAWHKNAITGTYYYAIFDKSMPDLNYRNADVSKEMEDITRFWLKDVGIDGLRLDAARHLIEEGKAQSNTRSTHAWYQQFYTFYKNINPNALTIGEVWDSVSAMAPYVKNNELDLVFNFNLANAYVNGVRSRNANQLRGAVQYDLTYMPFNQYGSFLTNHDMDRVMSQFSSDMARMKSAAVLYLTGPGVPFIYYGEEIGMTGSKPDEDIRTPMQWSAEANAGFTTGKPWESVHGDYINKNVAAQSLDPNALLPLYRRLVALRKEHSALRQGNYVPIDCGNEYVYAALRTSDTESILIVLNLSDSPQKAYGLSLPTSALRGKYLPDPLLGEAAGTYATLKVGAQGEFDAYMPLPELPSGARLVLMLTQ